jgi:hypothetical protein
MRFLLFIIFTVVAGAYACSPWSAERVRLAETSQIQDELAKYKERLKFSISPERVKILSGEMLSVDFTLTNIGSEDLAPCLTSRSAMHFRGLDKHYVAVVEIEATDHLSCEKTLFIPSGRSVSWSTEISVPIMPGSTAELISSIYLVYPQKCERYGCYGVPLSAHASPLTILE